MSNPLSESEQDANIATSYAARPGTTDERPTGVSASTDQSIASAVKDKLDAVAEQAPSTQTITDQLPSAQSATDALKSGASALVAGISNLATGASNATKDIAAEAHPESGKPTSVDDLHIPGAFDDTTSDREDIAAVQRGAEASARSLQNQAQQGAEYVKQQMPGQQNAVGQQTQVEDSRAHKEGTDYIKDQVFGQGNPAITSVGAGSTTNQLAGQVPLESRGVPQIVADSQRQAGEAAPLDLPGYNPVGKTSTTNQLAGQVPIQPRGVPQVVSESQRRAGEPPEASSNPDAVLEKRQVEQELQREVPQQASSSGPSVTQTIAGGAAALGTAAAGAAGYAREKTHQATGTDPVSVLPDSAQRAVDRNIGISTSSVTTEQRAHQGSSTNETGYPRVVGISQPSGSGQQGGIHNTVIGVGSSNPFDTLQQGGIHNRVVGAGSSGVLDSHERVTTSSVGQTSSAGVSHLSSVEGVDLSAGIKNRVTGAGGKDSI